MTTVPSAFDAPPAASIEDEHSVQIGLVHAQREAIHAGDNAPRTSEILDQLLTYSDVHFMSSDFYRDWARRTRDSA